MSFGYGAGGVADGPDEPLCDYCKENTVDEFECDECGLFLCGGCAQDEQNGEGGIFCPAHER